MIERADLTTRPTGVFKDRDDAMAFCRRTGATRAERDPKTGAIRAASPGSSSPRSAAPVRRVDPVAERVARAQRLWVDAMVAASKAKAHEEDTWRRYRLEKAIAGR
jgi:hypothetical protein